jgi:hypothetical protein
MLYLLAIGFPVVLAGDSPKYLHMCFVDDLILVVEASSSQVNCITYILQEFCEV